MPAQRPTAVSQSGASRLEQLLAARSALVREARDLHARYGPGGTFVARRETLRAELSIEMRTRLEGGEGRITQSMIDEAVVTHPEYTAFIAEAEAGRAQLYVQYDEIRAASARITEHLAHARGAASDDLDELSEDPDGAV